MKHTLIFSSFFICLLLISCNSKTVTINGSIIGDLQDELVYFPPVEGHANELFKKTINPETNGKFCLNFEIEETSPVLISLFGKSGKYVIVEPGNEYSCTIKLTENGFDLTFAGANEEGNKLFKDRPIHIQRDTVRKIFRSPDIQFNPDDISGKIQQQKERELKIYTQLMEEKKITASFMKRVEFELSCYYAHLLAEILFTKYYMLLRTDKDSASPFKDAFMATFKDFPPNDSNLSKAFSWYSYAHDYLTFLIIMNYDQQKLQEIYQQGLSKTFEMEQIDKYFTVADVNEYYKAAYLCFEGMQERFEKDLVTIFERYQSEYPKSPYISYITPYVDSIINFYDTIDKPYSSSMNLADNMDEINTFTEAIAPYKGKRLYIDVWATWCGPCKKEFQYNEGLKELLKEKDIQMLYISIDKQSDKTKWEDMIKYYNLEGNHILANEEFVANLRKLYDKNGMIAIPWYILIDEQGKIKELHFKGPSKIEELKKIL